jgi:hypothetical protein
MTLDECDALNLRALLRREKGGCAEAALNDARQALRIAEACGYYWGRHEALRQLRNGAKALGARADENLWGQAEEELADQMKPELEEAIRFHRQHLEEVASLCF